MARISDKIDSHLFRRLRATAVGEVHHLLHRPNRLDAHVPHLALLADAGQADWMAGMLRLGIGQPLDRAGMAKGHPHILPDDVRSQKLPCYLVGC